MTNKEAIEILKNYHNGYFGYKIDDVHEAHNLAIKALNGRPQGEWIVTERGYECSKCREVHLSDYPFCHMCGADMRKEANNETN